MAVYFVDKYSNLYSKMDNEKSIAEYYASLESSVNEISSELNGVMDLLNELEGNYTKELRVNLSNFIIETKNTYQMIGSNLKEVSDEVNVLSGNLSSFQSSDQNLEDQQGVLEDIRSAMNNLKYREDSAEKESTLRAYATKISGLSLLIGQIEQETLEFRDKCDINIETINKFNEDIVDLRLRMASIAAMNDGYSLEQIEKMTPEEKKKVLSDLLEKMTEKYNNYKKAYEEYYQKMIEDPESLRVLYGLYRSITQDMDYDLLDLSENAVPSGLYIAEFLVAMGDCKTKNGKSLIDCLRDYNNGASWTESGMAELYQYYRDDQYNPEYDDVYESAFRDEWYNDVWLDEPADQLINNALDYYENNLVPNSAEFNKNYDSAVEVGVAIQGLKELNGHIKYDFYTETEDYRRVLGTVEDNDEFLLKVYFESDISLEKVRYMTSNELDMFKYLYETKGSAGAKEYIDSIHITLNRRKGYIDASNCYYDLISGNNSGIEAVGDHLKIGVIGYGDGIRGFVDGFVDLVAPSKELSAEEYAQTALLGYLTDGGTSYDNSLLVSYNLGSVAGQKTIPTILNLIKPGAGVVSEKISNFGNSLEDYVRANDSTTYGDALLHAGYDFLVDEGIDKFTGGLGDSKWFKAGVGATKSFMKDVGNAYFFEKDNKIDLKKHIKSVITTGLSETVTDAVGNYAKSMGFTEPTISIGKKIGSPFIGAGIKSGVNAAESMLNGEDGYAKAESTFNKELGGAIANSALKGIDQKFGKKE